MNVSRQMGATNTVLYSLRVKLCIMGFLYDINMLMSYGTSIIQPVG